VVTGQIGGNDISLRLLSGGRVRAGRPAKKTHLWLGQKAKELLASWERAARTSVLPVKTRKKEAGGRKKQKSRAPIKA